MNLIELTERVSSEEEARKLLEEMRWPNGVRCPRCGHEHVSRLKDYHKFECAACEYQFSVTSGTFMHKTRTSLRKWLIAIYMICESKKGISAKQIERTIGVSYPTAWFMMHRIREAMRPGEGEAGLGGILEMDEAYIGGKEKGIGAGRPGKRSKKVAVLGIIERSGRVRCKAVPNVGRDEIMDFASHVIARGAVDVIYTDMHSSYSIFDGEFDHRRINHKLSYVEGDIHTNGIEGFWSLLKRGIHGAFHYVSAKHLQRYLDEFIWRFDNRGNARIFETLLASCGDSRLAYGELTG